MKIDARKSVYHEAPGVREEFDPGELRKLRVLLRRLRFLESKIAEIGGLANGGNDGGGAVFVEAEVDALEFALDEIGFLETRPKRKAQG